MAVHLRVDLEIEIVEGFGVEDLVRKLLQTVGAGKTTLLRHLAASLAREEDPDFVPVFASLPRLMRRGDWFIERQIRELERQGRAIAGLKGVLEQAGKDGRLLLLFDGLDEVQRDDRDAAERLLRDVASRWPETPIVVSTRPIGYRRFDPNFRELTLLPLDRERRLTFLAKWFGRRHDRPDRARARRELKVLQADMNLWELSGNPLYLTLMALLFEQGTSPERHRMKLYSQVFDLLLEGRHKLQQQPIDCRDGVHRALRFLAHEMTKDNRDAEPVHELETRLYQPAADELRYLLEQVRCWHRSLRPFLDDVSEKTGILGSHDGPEADWRFWHRTFREALTAEKLAEVVKQEGQEAVLEHARNLQGDESRWAEPYALLTGLVDDADALIKALLEANQDLAWRALATAQGLRPDTLSELLELGGDVDARSKVYLRVPELVGEGDRALRLLDRLRRQTSDGNDLYFIDLAALGVARQFSDFAERAEQFRRQLYDHLAEPRQEAFQSITTRDGEVELWCEIPAGTYWVGSPEGEGYGDERPRHRVTLQRPFRLAAVTVTNAQYRIFDPSYEPRSWEGVGEDELAFHPAVGVSWYAAVSFCRWLSTADWARGARLPLEEEWEIACRAGTETRYSSGDDEVDLARVGWYDQNSDGRTHRVGEKPRNAWGLYDMHGNVWEWTLSPWREDYQHHAQGWGLDSGKIVLQDPPENAALPSASAGARRVIRGGSYWDNADGARAAYRNHRNPGIGIGDRGFRVTLPPPSSKVEEGS